MIRQWLFDHTVLLDWQRRLEMYLRGKLICSRKGHTDIEWYTRKSETVYAYDFECGYCGKEGEF